MSPDCKMSDNGRLTVDQKVKVVLVYAETKSAVATQRRFRAHFGTRWAPCKQIIYRLSLGTIFQPMRINSVSDVKYFCNNKNVLCLQSVVWHFVSHPVRSKMLQSSRRNWVSVLIILVSASSNGWVQCKHRLAFRATTLDLQQFSAREEPSWFLRRFQRQALTFWVN